MFKKRNIAAKIQRYAKHTTRYLPDKGFENPEFVLSARISRKRGDLPKLDWLQDVPERVNIIQSLFFPESLG